MEKRAELVFWGNEFLEKRADGSDLLTAAGSLGAAATAVIGANLLSKSYGQDFQKKLKTTKRVPPSNMVHTLKRTAGLEKMPHHQVKGLPNAFYLPGGNINKTFQDQLKRQEEKARQEGDKDSERLARNLRKATESPHGGIFYGEEFKNPYVIAHEVGHALAANEPAFKRYVERSPSLLNKLFGVGAAAGTVAGIMRPDWIPAIGAGLAGLGAVNLASTVYSENKATERGLDLMDRAKMSVEPEGREALDIAGKSYLWPGMLSKVVAPLAAAGTASLIQNWD